MPELSEYDAVNNPELAGPGKPVKETPIKRSPKPVKSGPQLSEYNTTSDANTFEVKTGSPGKESTDGEYVVGTNLNEQRAQRQGALENVFSGLAKGTGLLGTTVGSLVSSLPEGIIRASIDGLDPTKNKEEAFSKIYDNYSAGKLNQFNEFMETAFPNYYSEKEQRADAFSATNLGSSNFWGDKVIKNAGFTVGAIIGGKGISSLGKIATGAKYLDNAKTVATLVSGGIDAAQAVRTVATGAKFADKASQLATGVIMSTGEASMEAKQVKDELTKQLTDKYKAANNGAEPVGEELNTINRTASSAGNVTMAVNMAVLTASDTFQFGKLWSKGFKEEIDRVGKIAVKDGVATAIKQSKVLNAVKSAVPNALSESAEEGTQTATQAGAKDYYSRKYDKKGLADTNDMVSGMLTGLQETFGTKNGIESMLLGAITGIGSSSVLGGLSKISNWNSPSEYENTVQAAQQLNSVNSRVKPFIEAYTRGVSINKDKEDNAASEVPSRLLHESLNVEEFRNIVQPYIETGRFDLLEEKLNDELQKDEEQFRADNGDAVTRKSGKDYTSKLMRDAKALKENWDNIQEVMPKFDPIVRERVWSLTANIANRNTRAEGLNTLLYSQTGVNYTPNKSAQEYVAELTAIKESGKVVDNSGKIIDYGLAEDVVNLFAEAKALSQEYTRILDPTIQQQIVAETIQQEEEKKAFEPESVNIPTQEYNNFVDTGIVSDAILNSIANKVKNNEKLDERETAIFNDKTAEINDILKSTVNTPEEASQTTKTILPTAEVSEYNSDQPEASNDVIEPAVEFESVDSLFDEEETSTEELSRPEIVANNNVVEEPLTQEDVEAKTIEEAAANTSYSELDRMASTTLRTTQNHQQAIDDNLFSVQRYQNFLNNPYSNFSGLELMVVTPSNPAYSTLLNKNQAKYHETNLILSTDVFVVVVDSQTKQLIVVENTGERIGYTTLEEMPFAIDDDNQGIVVSRLVTNPETKDNSGYESVSYQSFARVNGIADGKESDAKNSDTKLGKLWAEHKAELARNREGMINGSIKYLAITGSSPGIFYNTQDKYGPVRSNIVDVFNKKNSNINSSAFKFIVETVPDIATPGKKTIKVGEKGLEKEQTLTVGRPYLSYNGKLFPLNTRPLSSEEVNNVVALFNEIVNSPKRKAYLLGKIKELVYINPNTLNTILDGSLTGEDLKNYLADRFRQVDTKLLNTNAEGNYGVAKLDKGTVRGGVKQSYRDFITSGDNPVLTLNFRPQQTTFNKVNGEQKMKPNYLNGYLEYSPILSELDDIVIKVEQEQQLTVEEVVAPKPKGKKVYKPIIIEDDNELLRRASQKTSDKKEDIATLKKWFESRFDGESFEVVDKLINGNGFGQYVASGIKLFSGAEEGTGYHEAFHKVTQEYLTPKQIKSLYTDVRNTVNNKFTDFQAEEYLAEDFRNFMLSSQKAIKGRPVSNNIFRKLYNYLKSLLTGKTTPEQIYNKLASRKGFSGAKKFNVQQFNKLQRAIPGLTHQQTQNIVESVNSHFFNVLFESGKTPDQILGKSGQELVKKAYSIVFKRLATRDFAALVRDQDDYSDEEYNAITDHYDFLLNINEEGQPTSLNQAAIDAHKGYLKGLGIYLGENVGVNQEEIDVEQDVDSNPTGEDEIETRNKAEWKNANEDNTLYSTPNSIKLLVMSLPAIDRDGNPVANNIGGPKLNSYKDTLNLLYKNLNGLTHFHEMYAKLEELSPRFPVFKELIKRLGAPGNNKSQPQFLLENDFRQAFAKFESKGTITLINPDNGEIYQVDANANKLRDKIKENWTSNLRVLANDKSSYIKTGDDGILAISDTFEDVGRKLIKEGNTKEMLRNIGIEFTDLTREEIEKLYKEDEYVRDDINAIFEFLTKEVGKGTVVNSLFDKKVSISSRLNSLLDVEAELSKETVELSYISAEGKRIYAVSLNHYYSLVINALNNATSKQDLFDKYPHLGNPYTKNSVWLKSLFNKDGSRVSGNGAYMNTVSGLKLDNDVDSGKGATKMEPSDKIVQEINDLLGYGTASLIRAADKSSEYVPGIKMYANGENLAIPLKSVQENGFASSEVYEIFKGYFNDELARIRQFLGAEGETRVGNNIAIYNKQAANFSLFADILTPETLKELAPYKESYEELSLDLEAKIGKEIESYLESYAKDVKAYMQSRKVGLKYDKGFTGIDPEYTGTSEKGLDAAIKTFTVNHLVNMIEQSKLLVGDSAFFKDKIKRISAGTGTKKFAASDSLTNNWINNYYKSDTGRIDNKVADGKINVVIFDDVKAYQENIEEYIDALEKSGITKERSRDILADYAKWNPETNSWEATMDEGDAQGWITLDEYREFMMRVGGAYWTAEHEAQYRYELALERGEENLVNPNFYFMPIKAQYFGPQAMSNIYAPAFHKYSLAPIYSSLVKGRNMEKLLTDMRASKTGYALFASGSKVGTPLDSKGKLPTFYDSDGNMSGITDTTPVQQIYYEFLGIQLDIAPKVKDKIIFGSQARKLLFSNMFGESPKEWASALAIEYNKLIDDSVTSEFKKLTKKLGITYKEDGSFTFNGDYKKLVEQLKEQLADKDTADNILDSLQTNEDGSLVYPIDSMVNRDKIEKMLFSIVNNKVIKQKMGGNSLVQHASSGMEPAGKREIGKSNYLKFYTQEGVNGATSAMEVEIPMNNNFKPLLDKYKGDLDALNKAISEGKINSKQITMVGYRIPTQGLNSMDVMTIKRFMPESSGIAIILPTGVVAKSGGDYDIDKMNIFMPKMLSIEYGIIRTARIALGNSSDNYTDEQILDTIKKYKNIYDNKNDVRSLKITFTEKQILEAEKTHDYSRDGIVVKSFEGSTKEGRQNRLIEIMSEVLTHPDNFIELTTPNTVAKLKDIVKNIREAREQSTDNASQTRQFRFDYLMDQFDVYLGGKAALGIAATHNTHHILSQIAKVNLNIKSDDFPFKANLDKDANVFLGGTTTQSGAKISDNISQFINAYVDVAKDPFYKDLNAGTEVASIWMYLLRAGVDEYTIGYFMSQPIIVEYVNARKLNKSLVVSSNSQDKTPKRIKAEIYSGVISKYGVDYKVNTTDFKSDDINNTLLGYISEGKSANKSDTFREAQTQLLQTFIEIEKQSSELTSLMQVTNADTTITRSFGSLNNERAKRDKVEQSKIIPVGTAQRIRDTTIVGSFDKGQQFSNMFSELSLYMSKPEIKSGIDSLISNIDKKKDFEKEYTKIQNDFVGYLTQLHGKTIDGKPLYSQMDLLFGDNSLAKQLIQLNKEGLLEDNVFTKELIAQVSERTDGLDNIKMYSRRMTAFESNVISESFRDLLSNNNPRLVAFGQDLAYLTILQSGLNNSPITFTELIPFEFYGNIVKGAFNTAQQAGINMQDFQTRFYNKQNNKNGFRVQDFGLSAESLPIISVEQQKADAQLPVVNDSNVEIANEDVVNNIQQVDNVDETEAISENVNESTADIITTPTQILSIKIGQQQLSIQGINTIADNNEQQGLIEKICKI